MLRRVRSQVGGVFALVLVAACGASTSESSARTTAESVKVAGDESSAATTAESVKVAGGESSAATTAERVPVAEGESISLRVGATLSGTLADRDALSRLDHATYQGGLQSCMAAAGFLYTPPLLWPRAGDPAVNHLPGFVEVLIEISDGRSWPDNFDVGPTFKRMMKIYATMGLRVGEDAPNPGWENAPDQSAYDVQLDICNPKEEPSFYPALADELWGDAASVAQKAVANDSMIDAALRDYPACMAKFGFDGVLGRGDLRQKLADDVSRLAASSDVWSDELVQMENRERQAAAADRECRSVAHERAVVLVAPVLAAWEDEHAADLATIAEQWRQIRVQSAAAWAEFVAHHPNPRMVGGQSLALDG